MFFVWGKVPYSYAFLKVLHIIPKSKESYHMMNFVDNNSNNFLLISQAFYLWKKTVVGKPVTYLSVKQDIGASKFTKSLTKRCCYFGFGSTLYSDLA